MPHPDEDLELPGNPKRRPSHFRKKRRESTTKLIRVAHDSSRPSSDVSHVVRSPKARQEAWSDVINPAPTLPEPVLQRPLPPPAPLPSQTVSDEPASPSWIDDRQRRKRREDVLGTIVLAAMVTAMLIAMWLRMTGG